MTRLRVAAFRSGLVGFHLMLMVPSLAAAQTSLVRPARGLGVLAPRAWSEPSGLPLTETLGHLNQSQPNRSSARLIATHTLVGAGAGLLIGLVLSAASTTDGETSVVITWTALGAAAGLASGVVTWLIGRRE